MQGIVTKRGLFHADFNLPYIRSLLIHGMIATNKSDYCPVTKKKGSQVLSLNASFQFKSIWILTQDAFSPGACMFSAQHACAGEHAYRLLLRVEMLLLLLGFVTVRARTCAVRQRSPSLTFRACRKGFPFSGKRGEVSRHESAAATVTRRP